MTDHDLKGPYERLEPDPDIERKWMRLRASIFIRDSVEDNLRTVKESSSDWFTRDELIMIDRVLEAIKVLRDKIEGGCKT